MFARVVTQWFAVSFVSVKYSKSNLVFVWCGCVVRAKDLCVSCVHLAKSLSHVYPSGYKYWSCCDKRKTFDFEEFLAFAGCQQCDTCKWFKDEGDVAEKKQCRYVWRRTCDDLLVRTLVE